MPEISRPIKQLEVCLIMKKKAMLAWSSNKEAFWELNIEKEELGEKTNCDKKSPNVALISD